MPFFNRKMKSHSATMNIEMVPLDCSQAQPT
jgi:hypothetical protein